MREALDHVSGPGFVHVSLDMDALDPEVAPGVGTPVRGGLTYREAHLAMELVAESGLAGSLEVVEVNPILDRENTTAADRRRARRERAREDDLLAERQLRQSRDRPSRRPAAGSSRDRDRRASELRRCGKAG